ncbi:MAG: hypothetical protein DRP58_04125 [Spirochaetes bacterium]|nr:MAG: hypothetical protein DRP58_04125 [Spirochaetota bacterium]
MKLPDVFYEYYSIAFETILQVKKSRQFGWNALSASDVRGTMFLLLSEVNRTFKKIFSRRILKIYNKQNYYFYTVEQNERILKDKLEVE